MAGRRIYIYIHIYIYLYIYNLRDGWEENAVCSTYSPIAALFTQYALVVQVSAAVTCLYSAACGTIPLNPPMA